MKFFVKKIVLILQVLLFVGSLHAQDANSILQKYYKINGGFPKLNSYMNNTTFKSKLVRIAKDSTTVNDTLIFEYKDSQQLGQKISSIIEKAEYTIYITSLELPDTGQTVHRFKFKEAGLEDIVKVKTKTKAERVKEINNVSFACVCCSYLDKGNKAKLVGKEIVRSRNCYKIEYIRNKAWADTTDGDFIEYCYFDVKSGQLVTEVKLYTSGSKKGTAEETFYAEFKPLKDVRIPYKIIQYINGVESHHFYLYDYTTDAQFMSEDFALHK